MDYRLRAVKPGGTWDSGHHAGYRDGGGRAEPAWKPEEGLKSQGWLPILLTPQVSHLRGETRKAERLQRAGLIRRWGGLRSFI